VPAVALPLAPPVPAVVDALPPWGLLPPSGAEPAEPALAVLPATGACPPPPILGESVSDEQA
jgi:hypothetical protein